MACAIWIFHLRAIGFGKKMYTDKFLAHIQATKESLVEELLFIILSAHTLMPIIRPWYGHSTVVVLNNGRYK